MNNRTPTYGKKNLEVPGVGAGVNPMLEGSTEEEAGESPKQEKKEQRKMASPGKRAAAQRKFVKGKQEEFDERSKKGKEEKY
jgi:hypothetical protein